MNNLSQENKVILKQSLEEYLQKQLNKMDSQIPAIMPLKDWIVYCEPLENNELQKEEIQAKLPAEVLNRHSYHLFLLLQGT